MGKRRKARELALQILYKTELNPHESADIHEVFWGKEDIEDDIREFSEILIKGVLEKKDEIDEMIKKIIKNWDMSRLNIIDLNIIRLAAFEMKYLSQSEKSDENIPPIVSINEAVEVAKKYGSPDSGKFVNGILDQIRKEISR